jgi:O-antigen ligase/Tfp pilus assembly protein PilF
MATASPKQSNASYQQWMYMLFLLALPLVYADALVDPVVVPRQMLWCVMLLAVCAGIIMQKQIPETFPVQPVLVCFVLIVPVMMLTSVQSFSMADAYYSLSKWILIVLFPALTWMLLRSGKLKVEGIALAVLSTVAFTCAATLWQMAELSARGINIFKEYNLYGVKATFGHKNLLSSWLFLTLPFSCISLGVLGGWKQKAGMFITVLSVLLIGVLQTRAVLAGVLAGGFVTMVVALCLFRHSRHARFVRIMSASLVLMVAFSATFVWLKRDRIGMLTRTESARERINIWSNTVQMIAENPLTGVGAGNWQVHFPKYGLTRFYDTNYLISEGLTNFQRPHNDFLWVFAEGGLSAFLLYLFVFALLIAYVLRLAFTAPGVGGKLRALILLFTLCGYIVIAALDFPLERIEHQVLLGILVAYILFLRGGGEQHSVGRTIRTWHIIIITLCVSLSLVVSTQRAKGEFHSHKLLVAHRQAAWARMITEGRKALNPFYQLDPMSIPVQWYMGVAQFTMGDQKQAAQSFEAAYRLHPFQVHVLNNYATCFEKEGEHARAIELFETMHRISPKFSDGIINLSGAYYNAGRFDDAYRMMSTFPWDPDNPRSHSFMGPIFAKKLNMVADSVGGSVGARLKQCAADDECVLTGFRQSQAENIPLHIYLLRKP